MQNWILPDMDFSIYPKHHISCWHELVQWNLSLHDESNPTRWLSWAQIFADFRLSTKLKGPWYDRKTKRWMSVGCPNDEFLRRYHWFKDFLNSVMALHKRQLPTRMCRPDSFVIGFWCLCLPVQISGERFEAIESWFVSKHPFFRSTPDLRLLKEAPWQPGHVQGSIAVCCGRRIETVSKECQKSGVLVREIPLFQGNLGWWNTIIWPDPMNEEKLPQWKDPPDLKMYLTI